MFQLYLMGGLYILLGFAHFTHTGFYRPLMPQFLPAHVLLIYLSGFAEIILGFGVFFPLTLNYALWGIMLLLTLFLIIHINMLFPGNRLGVSLWLLWLRIPLQFLLIYWAYINL
ncbi:MAG: hypothetical protein CBC08_04355 [Flavobacteriaceae bacterium TMED48]|nr:MAG: hypothetical protein CBC08_04355 [Flavobacteriaceae bacterium TMED48]